MLAGLAPSQGPRKTVLCLSRNRGWLAGSLRSSLAHRRVTPSCSHGVCVCVQMCPFYKGISQTGLEAHLTPVGPHLN